MTREKREQVDIIVIGAGLTGLTVAYHLKELGLKVQILECSKHVGGAIQTFHQGGFTFESGPNTGVVGSVEMAEILGLVPDLQLIADPSAKKRLILKNGQFYPLPSGAKSGIKTPLVSLKDKFRLLLEPFRKPGTDPNESLASLVERRLGKSYLKYAVDPFIGGIYAGDPRLLVTRYALPKLYALEQNYGSFIRGAIAKRKEPKAPKAELITREVFSTRGGLGALTDRLADLIGRASIHLGVSDCSITPLSDGYWEASYTQTGISYQLRGKHIITTCAAPQLRSLLPFLSEVDLAPILSLRYAPVIQVSWGKEGLSLPHFHAFGGLVPSLEDKQLLGILNPSACFPDRAPKGGTLLSIFLGGMRSPDLIDASDEEIKQIVSDRLRRLLRIEGNPDLLRIFRHRYAIPQYEASSEARIAQIAQLEARYPGLHLAGAIRDGIGMSDRVQQAKLMAHELAEALSNHG